MAARHSLRLPRAAAAVALGGTAILLFPRRTAFAESPQQDYLPAKKPIYSDPSIVTTLPKPPPTSSAADPTPRSQTPTDRLTEQVKKARLYLYNQSLVAEDGTNSLISWAFKQESSIANTIASLAPGPETGEELVPGVIYVLVATLLGSILARNRGIVLRATIPLAAGITAGWLLIPVTMNNIAELSWHYEQKVPVISRTHSYISGFTREAWRQTKVHTQVANQWADQTAADSRKRVENWVEKGR